MKLVDHAGFLFGCLTLEGETCVAAFALQPLASAADALRFPLYVLEAKFGGLKVCVCVIASSVRFR